jgi:hypothetical protein
MLLAVLVCGAAVAMGEKPGEPILLFNGKNLDGWVIEGDDKAQTNKDGEPSWRVVDGIVVCESKGFGFLRYAEREFADFVLTVEYKLDKGGNTGIGIRTGPYDPKDSHASRPSYFGYEVQLLDDAGKPASKTGTASLYRYIAPTENASKPAGEWNTIEITCKGPKISIVLNGKKVLDADQSMIKGLEKKPLKGSICLQLHHTKAEFRSVTVRELRD